MVIVAGRFLLPAPQHYRKIDATSELTVNDSIRNAERLPSHVAWFCVRSQPKHEHIAARHLRQLEGVEVFNPRIRFTRSTRQGSATVTESLFPNYLFARFDWKIMLTVVHYAPGVSGVVHFGCKWPTVPDAVVEGIRSMLGPEEIHLISNDLAAGDLVELTGGAFHGLQAVIAQVMPGKQRVMVLMDFLGRQTTIELEAASVIKHSTGR
jgi:transcriptional antiterminator RfaH